MNTRTRPSRPALPVLLLGALTLLISLTVAVVLYQKFGSSEVGYGVQSFDVRSDTQVRVVFQVVKQPGETALCTVRARDRYGAEVGSDLVRVPPADRGTVVVTHDLTTRGRAVSGEVPACRLAAS